MLELIQLACQRVNIPVTATGNLIEALQAQSSKLLASDFGGQIEEPDQENDFNELVQKFFQTLQESKVF